MNKMELFETDLKVISKMRKSTILINTEELIYKIHSQKNNIDSLTTLNRILRDGEAILEKEKMQLQELAIFWEKKYRYYKDSFHQEFDAKIELWMKADQGNNAQSKEVLK
jgi:hypothetical protein